MTKKDLIERLTKCAIGGNSLAVYLSAKDIFPEKIKNFKEAQEQLDTLDYEVWCCWKSIMEATDILN